MAGWFVPHSHKQLFSIGKSKGSDAQETDTFRRRKRCQPGDLICAKKTTKKRAGDDPRVFYSIFLKVL
jgi:hypothetical protein